MGKIILVLVSAAALASCSTGGAPGIGAEARFGDPDCDGMLVEFLGLRFCVKGVKSEEQRYNEQLLTELYYAAGGGGK